MFKKIVSKLYKTFLISLVGIRYFFMSLFTDDTDDAPEKKRPFIKKKIENKDNNIDYIYYEVKKITKEIINLENNLSMDKKEVKKELIKLNDRLIELDTKRKNIVPKNNIMKATNFEASKVINKNKKEIKEYAYHNKIDIKPKEEKPKAKKTNNQVKEISMSEVVNLADNKDNLKAIYSLYVVAANNTLKEAKNLLKEVEEDTKKNRYFDNNKYKILDLKEKIKKLKNNYYEFKHNRYIYELENDFDLKELDEYEILINSNNIDLYLKKCNAMLYKIEEYKKHDDIKEEKSDTKEEVKEEKKKEEPKKEVRSKLSIELEEAYNVIYRDIKRQEALIDKLEISINNLPPFERKKKRLGFFGSMLSNTLKFTMTFLPFRFIRNRKVNMLLRGFMINNNIRTMRKTLSKDVICDYVVINRYLKTEEDLTQNYERICRDSLYQVSVLKEEFIMHYGYLRNDEVMKMYNKLDELEEYITSEIERLNEITESIGKVKKMTRRK